MVRARVWGLVAVVLVVATAAALRGTQRPARAPRAGVAPPDVADLPPGPAAADAPPVPRSDLPGAFAARVAALDAALAAGGAAAQDAAADLRRLLRTDEQSRRAAEAALLDPGTRRELRMALALVFGTLPGSDAVLLDALDRFAADPELVRCALLALGATREPIDEDDVFGLGDRPYGEGGPKGIGITVRREIDDARVRAEIGSRLAAGEAANRRAAAVALRASIARLDVRDAFLAALRGDADDGVAGVVGEALAQWAGGPGDEAERSQIVEALLLRAGDDGLDGYRFRLEDDFARIPLGTAERAALAGLTRPPHPLGIRSFAIRALAGSAARSGGEALDGARELLGGYLRDDADAAVRDMAARMLGRLPLDDVAIGRLARASSQDGEWHVRYAAVEALGSAPTPAALAALRAAASEADERVAARARELLRDLEER